MASRAQKMSSHDKSAALKLLRSLNRLLSSIDEIPDFNIQNKLAERVSQHLNADASELPITSQTFPPYQLVDMQISFELWEHEASSRSVEIIGIAGQHTHHQSFRELIQPHQRYDVGPVEYADIADSPTTTRSCIAFGMLLLRDGDTSWAVILRGPEEHMRESCSLEIITSNPADAKRLLAELRVLAVRHSVLRGQVVALSPGEGQSYGGLRFMVRPQLARSDLILPESDIARIEGHVIGVANHHERLIAAGQHLKRGVLLYGPPGTGKTHTVRYLLSQLTDRTSFVLSGQSLGMIGQACALARLLSPSLVILEDIDLIAGDRSFTPIGSNALLFEVLNQIDGLDADVDVTFLLTTNRVDILEKALSERPGRVDVAVEISTPNADGRRQLLDLYGWKLGVRELPTAAIMPTVELTEGRTATFMREVVRRAALLAAAESPSGELKVSGEMLLRAATSLTDDRAQLTQSIMAGEAEPDAEPPWRQTSSAFRGGAVLAHRRVIHHVGSDDDVMPFGSDG